MSTAKDPFQSHLQRAADLFESGDVVKAGQIWQAILKKDPNHEVARTSLYKVKLYFDARATQDGLTGSKPLLPAAPTAPISPTSDNPEVPKLLEEGCSLYDAGQVERAIQIWERVLEMDPENAMAKGYINGAMRVQIQGPDLEGIEPSAPTIRDTTNFAKDIPVAPQEDSPAEPPPSEEISPPEVPPIPEVPSIPVVPSVPEIDVEQLLRDGCTLYDMGQPEDALKKWERALTAEPSHVLARAYIKDARKDLGLPPLEEDAIPAPSAAEASPPSLPQTVPDDERLEQLLREGVQLFDMGMAQEATDKWKQILEAKADHRDAQAYLVMAEREAQSASIAPTRSVSSPQPVPQKPEAKLSAEWSKSSSFVPMEAISLDTFEPKLLNTEPETSASPVAPPKKLTTPATNSHRKGLALPKALQGITLPPWLNSPVFILGIIVGIVVLIAGSIVYHRWKKDIALRDAIATFSAQALQPVARNSQIINLDDSPESIRQEAEQALGHDSLRAFYRAQELLRLLPGDASAAELLERAKTKMADDVSSPLATLKEYELQKQAGDLDSANRSITQMLLLTPDDAALKDRAARLLLALCQIHATKERWKEAEECIKRGRAIAPSDKSWNSRLKLLEHVQRMPKGERSPWLQLLG